jgi:hypothetical protein
MNDDGQLTQEEQKELAEYEVEVRRHKVLRSLLDDLPNKEEGEDDVFLIHDGEGEVTEEEREWVFQDVLKNKRDSIIRKRGS